MHCSTDYNLGNIYYYKNYRKLKIMKKFILAIGLLLRMFLCNCYAFDDGDFQYWNSESVSVKINKDWKIGLEEEWRFGDDAGDFYYQHSDLGLAYSGFANWFDLGINYRHIFEKKSSKWRVENRPHLNATLKWKLLDFGFSNRGRFEYRSRKDTEDFWRYRNKFTIKTPFKLTKFEIQPYVANEIYYDFDQGAFNRNRLYGGLGFKIFKHLKAEIFYLWQSSEKNNKWSNLNSLGTKLKISF